MQEPTPQDAVKSKDLELVRKEFLKASQQHPSLHWGIISLHIPTPRDQAVRDLLRPIVDFGEAYSHAIAKAVAGERVVLEVSPATHYKLPTECKLSETHTVKLPSFGYSDSFSRDFYFNDSPEGRTALGLYKELAHSAARCREADDEQMSDREALTAWHANLMCYTNHRADPIMRWRHGVIEVDQDRKRLCVGVAPPVDMPAGESIGIDGESRPLADVLFDLSQCDCNIAVLQTGLFRAGAHVLERKENGLMLAAVMGRQDPAAKDALPRAAALVQPGQQYQGEWIGPMSKTEVAKRISGDSNARWRKVESLFMAGYVECVSPHLVRVRVDHLDGPTREKLKKNP